MNIKIHYFQVEWKFFKTLLAKLMGKQIFISVSCTCLFTSVVFYEHIWICQWYSFFCWHIDFFVSSISQIMMHLSYGQQNSQSISNCFEMTVEFETLHEFCSWNVCVLQNSLWNLKLVGGFTQQRRQNAWEDRPYNIKEMQELLHLIHLFYI